MADTQVNKFQIEDNSVNTNKIETETILNEDISFSPGPISTTLIQRSKIENLNLDLNNLMNRSGDTATGQIQGISGTNSLDSITKQYVDDLFLTLSSSVSLRQKYPDVKQENTVGDTITISGYKVLAPTGLLTSAIDTTLQLISSNIENTPPVTFGSTYYLYLTPSGPKFSIVAPNSLRLHPTNNWIYVTAIFTSAGPNKIKPFYLKNGYYKFIDSQTTLLATSASGTYTLNLSSVISPTALFADLSFFGGSGSCSGVSANFLASLTSANVQTTRVITGYCGAGGGDNHGCGLQSEVLVYVDNLQVRVNLTVSASGSSTIRFGGFYESWH